MAEKTFVKITNKAIYKKLEEIEDKVDRTNGSVKAHRAWLNILTGAFGVSFLFIIGWLFRIRPNP